MKRVIIAVFVPDETPGIDVAVEIDGLAGFQDATVWEWPDFWRDSTEGVVGPSGDNTAGEDGWRA